MNTNTFAAVRRNLKNSKTHSKNINARKNFNTLHAETEADLSVISKSLMHDYNNLMTVITGNVDLILSQLPDDAPARKFLNDIHRASESSRALVKQFTSNLETDRSKGHSIDLNNFFLEKVHLFQAIAKSSINVKLQLGHLPNNADIKSIDLERIMVNLITNAREAMDKENGEINIRVSCIQNNAVIRVSDNGCGIKKEDIEKVFNFFYSSRDSSRQRGMGLAIVSHLISRNNGQISVNSTEGSGTAFTIKLPIA